MNLTVVSYGGGVNSTALLVGLAERFVRPSHILFADTGGEKPSTYDYLQAMRGWLAEQESWPSLTIVRNRGPHESLEAECIANETLPSLTFGNRGCSVKWKRQPQEQYLRELPEVREAWGRGEPVLRLLGIDAGEAHRAENIVDDERWRYEFPLIRWGWGREECIAAIKRAGLPVPVKSACFFCPASKKREVEQLAREQPTLLQRAVAMEAVARPHLGTVKGLGRSWAWGDYVRAEQAQRRLWPELDMPCMCFDGDND